MRTAAKIRALLTPAERRRAPVLLGLMIVGMGLEMLGIGLIVPAVALLTQGDLASRYPQLRPGLHFLGDPSQTQLVAGGMLALVGIYLVKTMFLVFLAWKQTRFAYDVQGELSQRLFTTYLRQPYTFHLQRNSAQLIRNTITEVNEFMHNIVLPALLILTEGLAVLGVAVLLMVIEPVGGVAVVLVLAVVSWGFHRTTRTRIARWGVGRQLHEGLRLQHLQQGLGGAKDVKLLGRESDFLALYGAHNLQSVRASQRQVFLQQLPRLGLELLGVTGLATLVLTMVARGRPLADVVPALGVFAVGAFRLMPSVNRILGAVQSLRYGAPAIDVLLAELSLPAHETGRPDAAGPPFATRIELGAVNFTYPGAAAPSLTDVSLTVERGESIGVVGPSGSGKSTLVDVTLGLLTPSGGQVRVDGEDIQRNLRAWQDQVGYVPQTVYLTDDSLRRNVAFGVRAEDIDDGAVRRAIKAAQLDGFVASLPDGLQTTVGERGVRISGGQRQRIGIARALYHDPAVLVLDEATSALDTDVEQDVMRAVTALHGRKTILIVAHRLSTVVHCDRLYRLEHGRVAAAGRPAEVLRPGRVV